MDEGFVIIPEDEFSFIDRYHGEVHMWNQVAINAGELLPRLEKNALRFLPSMYAAYDA